MTITAKTVSKAAQGINRRRQRALTAYQLQANRKQNRFSKVIADSFNAGVAQRNALRENRQRLEEDQQVLRQRFADATSNVLSRDTLDFLEKMSDIAAPTLTSIFTGYESSRADRAGRFEKLLDKREDGMKRLQQANELAFRDSSAQRTETMRQREGLFKTSTALSKTVFDAEDGFLGDEFDAAAKDIELEAAQEENRLARAHKEKLERQIQVYKTSERNASNRQALARLDKEHKMAVKRIELSNTKTIALEKQRDTNARQRLVIQHKNDEIIRQRTSADRKTQMEAEIKARAEAAKEQRTFTAGENAAQRTFTAGQNAAGRTFTLQRDAAGNAFTLQRDAAGNEFTLQRDAAGNVMTLQRDAAGRAFTLQRDATGNAFTLQRGAASVKVAQEAAKRLAEVRAAQEKAKEEARVEREKKAASDAEELRKKEQEDELARIGARNAGSLAVAKVKKNSSSRGASGSYLQSLRNAPPVTSTAGSAAPVPKAEVPAVKPVEDITPIAVPEGEVELDAAGGLSPVAQPVVGRTLDANGVGTNNTVSPDDPQVGAVVPLDDPGDPLDNNPDDVAPDTSLAPEDTAALAVQVAELLQDDEGFNALGADVTDDDIVQYAQGLLGTNTALNNIFGNRQVS